MAAARQKHSSSVVFPLPGPPRSTIRFGGLCAVNSSLAVNGSGSRRPLPVSPPASAQTRGMMKIRAISTSVGPLTSVIPENRM